MKSGLRTSRLTKLLAADGKELGSAEDGVEKDKLASESLAQLGNRCQGIRHLRSDPSRDSISKLGTCGYSTFMLKQAESSTEPP